MAILTVVLCDECGKEARRVVEVDHRLYCSRECYLTACKRFFDERWFEMLRSKEANQNTTIPASKIA